MQHFPNPLPQGVQALRIRFSRFRERITAKRWPPASSLLFQFLFLLGLWTPATPAFAQTPPLAQACTPYTAKYPCAYVGSTFSDPDLVSVINESTNKVLGTINVVNPAGMVITPDNKFVHLAALVQNPTIITGVAYETGVVVIDTTKGYVVSNIALKGTSPPQIAITPHGGLVWALETTQIGTTQIVRIDTASHKIVGRSTLPAVLFATALAFTPDGKSAYVVGSCNDETQTCIERVDTTTFLADDPITIPNSLGVDAGIIVTPDGKFVCISTSIDSGGNLPQEFAVVFLPVGATQITANNIITTNVNGSPSSYGLGITPNGTLYAAAPYFGSSPLNNIFVFDTISVKYRGIITVGRGPTGIAVSADGNTVYATNNFDSNVSVIDAQFNTVAGNPIPINGNPSAIAAMPSIPPAITTQPAGQQIPYGGTATLSVVATGTATLTYQWYQGTSGDTTNPVQGATASSFTTPALTTPGLTATSYNYWVRVANSVAHQDSGTATVTVSPPVLPTITTQPSSPLIGIGSNATLSVQASGTLPLSYQWFQGQSGDTSTPIQGANGTSFMTPPLNATTNYWVQVSNVAGSVNSNTATVTVSPVPTCMLELRAAGGTAQAVVAMATCTDQTSPLLTTTLDWGDGTSVTVSGGTLQASHTYSSTTTPFNLMVTGINSLELTGFARSVLDLRPQVIQPPLVVFQGQPASFTALISAGLPQGQSVTVNFECTDVLDSNGIPQKASDLGISCYAVSQPILLSDNTPTKVTIVIQTSGAAIATLSHPGQQNVLYASLSGLFFLTGGISLFFIRLRALRYLVTTTGLLLILVVLSSCGGSFRAPQVTKTVTPAGNYQVSVVDVLASNNNGNPVQFVQTTLIVPLEVTPFQ